MAVAKHILWVDEIVALLNRNQPGTNQAWRDGLNQGMKVA